MNWMWETGTLYDCAMMWRAFNRPRDFTFRSHERENINCWLERALGTIWFGINREKILPKVLGKGKYGVDAINCCEHWLKFLCIGAPWTAKALVRELSDSIDVSRSGIARILQDIYGETCQWLTVLMIVRRTDVRCHRALSSSKLLSLLLAYLSSQKNRNLNFENGIISEMDLFSTVRLCMLF